MALLMAKGDILVNLSPFWQASTTRNLGQLWELYSFVVLEAPAVSLMLSEDCCLLATLAVSPVLSLPRFTAFDCSFSFWLLGAYV